MKKEIKVIYNILLIAIFLIISNSISYSQCEDTPNTSITTPRGTTVPDTYNTCEYDQPTIDWLNSYFATYYPNAEQLASASRTYNCHAYAWHMSEGGGPVWIGYNTYTAEDVYWTDGSYNEVSEPYCTKISYANNHSAISTGTTDIYISKWGGAPLMRHAYYYTPGYGPREHFYRRAVDVPQEYSSISSALSAAVLTQTVTVSSDNYSISQTLNVPGYVTLKINSGASLYFASGTGLTAYGTVNAYGVTFSGSNWNGIEIINSLAGNTDLNYCSITNVSNSNGAAVRILYNSPTIQNCYICYNNSSNTGGIYINSGGPTIRDNTISQNAGNGVYYFSGSGYLARNSIYASGNYGVYCDYWSTPYFGENGYTPTSNNVISSNNGVRAQSYSSPLVGWNSSSYYRNQNISGNSNYNIYVDQTSNVCAELVWWGDNPPNMSKIYVQSGGTLDIDPWLTSPPSGKITESDVTDVGHISFKMNMKFPIPQDGSLRDAMDLIINRKYVDAFNILKEIIIENKSDVEVIYSMIELLKIYRETKDESILSFAESISNDSDIKKSVKNQLLWKMNIVMGDYQSAKSIINNSISVNKNSDFNKYANIDLFYLYYLHLNDKVKANEVISELKTKYPDDINVNIAAGLMGQNDLINSKLIKPTLSGTNNNENINNDLLQNYPNPFNPSTQITYNIPKDGNVKLSIYDILGREISTLVNENKTVGRYSAQFNSDRLSSGTYFYRLVITPSNGEKEIIQQRALQVIK
jgi:hypothetical protein